MTQTEKRIEQLIREKKFNLAEEYLIDLISEAPTKAEYYFQLGNVYQSKGDVGKSIKAFSKCLELNSKHTEASISLSILYNDVGRYEKGKELFDQVNELVKSNKDFLSVGDLSVNKKFAMRHFELAELYASYSRFEEAIVEYGKAIKLNPNDLEIRLKVAKVYGQKGFSAKAIELLTELKNENPSYAPARVALGVLYYGQGKIIEAQNEWIRALSIDTSNKDASMYLELSKGATEVNIN